MNLNESKTKQERIRSVAVSYYARKDIQQAIYEFCKNRETIPKYFEGFGKRPNSLEYPSEVLTLAKNGATSFNCSEERWNDPLGISTDLNREELDNMRIGWDLIIDIDSKYFDYSKKAALAVIKALEFNGVHNMGIKFSGSRGWHIIIPWEAFPEEVNNIETRKMFPEWPRTVLEYLREIARKPLEEDLKKEKDSTLKKIAKGIKCETCGNMAEEFLEISLSCKKCKRNEKLRISADKKIKKRNCPDCRVEMEMHKENIYYCHTCKISALKGQQGFSKDYDFDVYELMGLDLVLISSRHLFRTPYSLHEKTALASMVLDKEKVRDFQPKDANPLGLTVKPFISKIKKEEAKKLLTEALDWHKTKFKKSEEKKKVDEDIKKKFSEVKIKQSEIIYPPAIKKILLGMQDGRKRALFILLNYFHCINFDWEEITNILEEWNKKNKKSLKEGYVKSQISWHMKQKKVLPPNYDKPHYKEIGINPEVEELNYKNPVSYTIKKFFRTKKSSKKSNPKQKR